MVSWMGLGSTLTPWTWRGTGARATMMVCRVTAAVVVGDRAAARFDHSTSTRRPDASRHHTSAARPRGRILRAALGLGRARQLLGIGKLAIAIGGFGGDDVEAAVLAAGLGDPAGEGLLVGGFPVSPGGGAAPPLPAEPEMARTSATPDSVPAWKVVNA